MSESLLFGDIDKANEELQRRGIEYQKATGEASRAEALIDFELARIMINARIIKPKADAQEAK